MANSDDIQMAAERLAICNTCESYLALPKMCKHCKCVMPFKVRIKKATCPIGKW